MLLYLSHTVYKTMIARILFENFIKWYYLNCGNKKNMPEILMYKIQEKVLIMLTKTKCKLVYQIL